MASNGNIGISDQAVSMYNYCVYGVVCQIINVFGIVTNIINIICFTKQGFKDSVNISLIGLAVSDLGSLITLVWTCISLLPGFMTAELPFDPIGVMYITSGMAHLSFTRVSGCITAMITLERCLCITIPLKIKSIITPKRVTIINVCVFITFFATSAPVYCVNKLDMTFSSFRNKTLVGLISTKDREHVEMFSFAINSFFIPLGAFLIISVCSTVLFFKLRSSAKWRIQTTATSSIDKVSKRNEKAAKMIVLISTLFIVCFIPVSFVMILIAFVPEFGINGKHVKIAIIVGGLGYLMESINSSANIFIYYRMSSNYRDTFLQFVFNKMKL